MSEKAPVDVLAEVMWQVSPNKGAFAELPEDLQEEFRRRARKAMGLLRGAGLELAPKGARVQVEQLRNALAEQTRMHAEWMAQVGEPCRKRGPYHPVGDVDWECVTHGFLLVQTGGDVGSPRREDMACPVGDRELIERLGLQEEVHRVAWVNVELDESQRPCCGPYCPLPVGHEGECP